MLRRRAGFDDVVELLAVQARDGMQHADEAAEQAILIEIAREHVDAPAVQRNLLFPIAARHRIETRAQEIVERLAVRLGVGRAEETGRNLVARQIGKRRKLESRQRDVIGVEIDRDDTLGVRGQIVQNVATARGDGDQRVMRLKRERFHVDIGVFPDLVVDKSLEHHREETLKRAALGRGRLVCAARLKRALGMGRGREFSFRLASI